MNFNEPARIIVTCMKWLAPYLEQEVKELGFTPKRVFSTGIELEGTLNDCIKLNLNLRCGGQVHYSLRAFRATHPEELYKALLHIPWEKVLAKDGYFSVTNHVENLFVNNTMFPNVKVKDAIVDRMKRESNERPNTGPDHDRAVIHLYWKDELAEIFIDTSGQTLSKHGYRKIPGKAPMLEALAASTLRASKWDRKSPFVNPMCGSSTLAIEAVMLATDRRPGLYRQNYGFMHILGYEESVYEKELNELKTKIQEIPDLKVIATDISEDAIEVSKVNAGIAGVADLIDFKVCDFQETEVPAGEKGIVFFNPEYGERLGEETELEGTYALIGDFMKKKCKGYTGYIFTGNLDLAKKIGLKASRRIEFYSAKIDCRLLEYDLYDGTRRPESKLKTTTD
jgi:23S rRNA G2445 N2-methylase RlmL